MDNQLIILTGISGAGRSSASFVLEELQYRVIDNLPAELSSSFIDLLTSDCSGRYRKTAVTTTLADALDLLHQIKKYPHLSFKLFLLTASKAELLSRYKLSRHLHPLQAEGLSLEEALEREKEAEVELRNQADYFIDTTNLSVIDLRKKLFALLRPSQPAPVTLNLVSFGFKYGIPADADLVLDARVVPNHFYIPELKNKTGKDQAVIDFINQQQATVKVFSALIKYLDVYLPLISAEARGMIVVAIGCSGGQHRSVYFAERLGEYYHNRYKVSISHRDIHRRHSL